MSKSYFQTWSIKAHLNHWIITTTTTTNRTSISTNTLITTTVALLLLLLHDVKSLETMTELHSKLALM